VTSALIDAIVRGSLGSPFRIVWANGNERQGSRCDVEGYGDYYSTAPPAGAKNHITVGALNSNDDSMTYFSSWGPVDDGRMKPDVSAPGCQSGGDGGVTSTSSSGDTAYTMKCGTSMASPTVCGLSALLLQDFRDQFPLESDPRNSTLKILLAHNAVDLGNPGPDYQYGYGSVRIQQTVDFMWTGNFLEDQVDQGGTFSVLVAVDSDDPELKVTLAWDDVPGTPNVDRALVNDLDLQVFDPASQQHYPWTLDPLNPSAAAVQTQANNVDNIEQVLVDNPAAGVWRIEVYGLNVPQGPQSFSLSASPTLIACSSQGTIALDSPKYPCSATAEIQVIDCDLNTDNGTQETVTVTIASDSEPGGESVLLTETGAETADFRRSIALDTVDGAGVLLVAEGDTVTATYIDADDGQGGINVPVTLTATVDCTPPVISNVQTIDIGPFGATVTFNTNEPTDGTVRYGSACGAWIDTAAGGGYETLHSIKLTGLTEDTKYSYVVDSGDEAGNTSTDDKDGDCYTFTTPDIPDYFTEFFDSADNDLDYLSLRFNPDGSYDFYSGCAEPITALPVDPSGGTPLVLSDDSFATINLEDGETVSLYDNSYSSFHVGSNGYITFTSGDSYYIESLASHFDLPRISALFDDFDPFLSLGTVSWKQLVDRVVVTWENVSEFGTINFNTFQVEMRFDGTIVISYLDIDAPDGLAGLSEGSGVQEDFYESDLSALGSCGEPTCADGIQNQGEDRIDCGGPCPPCDCLSDNECDDGLFCSGPETCDVYGACQPGTPVDCDDGVGCTDDWCDQATGACENTPDKGACDDGLFCNGVETCNAALDCQAGTDPCPGQDCDEATDTCDAPVCDNDGICEEGEDCNNCLNDCRQKTTGKPSSRYCCNGDLPDCGDKRCSDEGWVCVDSVCTEDPDCDDGQWCNGAETCVAGSCQGGNDPCPGQGCDETSDECVVVACGGNKAPCSVNSDCCSNVCKNGTCRGN
jgi:hypothetical protein